MKKKSLQLLAGARRMRGLSLVELMVAMTIGLILMAAVGYIYLGNAQTFRSLDDFSRIQENYRYALEQIGSELRMAGYAGCAVVSVAGSKITVSPLGAPLSVALAEGVDGYSNGVGWTNAAALAPNAAPQVAGIPPRDVLRVTLAQGAPAQVTNSTGATIPVSSNPANIQPGESAIISNCNGATVFTVGPVNAGAATAGTISSAGGSIPGYAAGAEVYRLADRFYYIGINGAGNTSLYRVENTPGAMREELIENVEALVLMLGVDTNDDLEADQYQSPAAVVNWQNVVSVRLNLVFVGNQPNTATQRVDYFVEGQQFTSPDNRLRQLATVTYGLRSRLPTTQP